MSTFDQRCGWCLKPTTYTSLWHHECETEWYDLSMCDEYYTKHKKCLLCVKNKKSIIICKLSMIKFGNLIVNYVMVALIPFIVVTLYIMPISEIWGMMNL